MHTSDADAALVRDVARVVSRPREQVANSFVLHAPLELLARTMLLPHVAPAAHAAACARIADIATRYEAYAPGIADPRPIDVERLLDGHGADRRAGLAQRAVAAIDDGDLDAADAAVAAATRRASPQDLGQLFAEPLLPRLGAAAHAPIFFELFDLAGPSSPHPELLRPLVRELARNPKWRIEWLDDTRRNDAPVDAGPLTALLEGVPGLGIPGNDFIYPLMHQLDSSGLAARELTPRVATVDASTAAQVLQRVAAQSMLQEPEDHAPYGWTHCLTMAQAALHCARWCRGSEGLAVGVAATFVLGFRAGEGTVALELDRVPERRSVPFEVALAEGRDGAAAAAYHHDDLGVLVTDLATFAAVREDAHLAKYVVACLRAAQEDPDASRLYLAAAASLCAFWHALEPSALPA